MHQLPHRTRHATWLWTMIENHATKCQHEDKQRGLQCGRTHTVDSESADMLIASICRIDTSNLDHAPNNIAFVVAVDRNGVIVAILRGQLVRVCMALAWPAKLQREAVGLVDGPAVSIEHYIGRHAVFAGQRTTTSGQ
jgi:hypothetical protein